jgi:flagellar M-ring protein FliF
MPFLMGLLAVAAVAMLYLAVRSTDYRAVLPNLAEEDKASVVEALTSGNFDVRVDPSTGSVQVPAADYHKARMLLAGQGLPKAAATGYDLLDDMPMGSSRALEAARLKQSQESELARSVAEISGVDAARVHLALPEQSVFVRERTPPSASVFLRLKPGRALGEAQVRSIVHLISSSVPGMASDNVSVVDQSGTLLTSDAAGEGLGESQRRVAYQSKLEDMYRQRLVSLLTPLVGPENFTAEVHLDLDFTTREATREAYDKANAVIRSEQTAMQQMSPAGEGTAPRGVPGALSNLPPPAATVADPAQQPAAGAAAPAAPVVPVPGPRSENVDRTYDVGKEISVTRTVAGDIRRATVAVVLRERPGKPVSKTELAAIEQLVRGAVGVDAGRGDVVAITARPFNQPTEEVAPEPWWKAEWVETQSRNVALVLVGAMLVFGVLRPLAKRALAPAPQREVEVPALVSNAPSETIDAGELRARSRRTAIPPELLTSAKDYDEKVALVRMFVSDDTGRASNVLKQLMRADAAQQAAGGGDE